MNIFDEYFKLQQEIYNYFGFKEDWVVLPLDDRRGYVWSIIDEDEVIYGSSATDISDYPENCYSDEIYKQRFYSKWIYRGEEYTMIMVDTHTDGNRFLAIYDNLKEVC